MKETRKRGRPTKQATKISKNTEAVKSKKAKKPEDSASKKAKKNVVGNSKKSMAGKANHQSAQSDEDYEKCSATICKMVAIIFAISRIY